MVGILLSYWGGLFSGATLVSESQLPFRLQSPDVNVSCHWRSWDTLQHPPAIQWALVQQMDMMCVFFFKAKTQVQQKWFQRFMDVFFLNNLLLLKNVLVGGCFLPPIWKICASSSNWIMKPQGFGVKNFAKIFELPPPSVCWMINDQLHEAESAYWIFSLCHLVPDFLLLRTVVSVHWISAKRHWCQRSWDLKIWDSDWMWWNIKIWCWLKKSNV